METRGAMKTMGGGGGGAGDKERARKPGTRVGWSTLLLDSLDKNQITYCR